MSDPLIRVTPAISFVSSGAMLDIVHADILTSVLADGSVGTNARRGHRVAKLHDGTCKGMYFWKMRKFRAAYKFFLECVEIELSYWIICDDGTSWHDSKSVEKCFFGNASDSDIDDIDIAKLFYDSFKVVLPDPPK